MLLTAARRDVTFESGDDQLAAWFYPGEGAGPRPCVVMGHGFAAVKEARLDAFAERFAAAGLACLVFDYRHFGGSGGEPRQVLDVPSQREDWDAAIRYARTLESVDSERIALWGTSFGGGLVLEAAARHADVRAAVLHLPLVDALSASEGIGSTLRLIVAGFCDLARRLTLRAPYLVPAVGPPGSTAFMTTPDAEPGYYSIVRDAPAWRNAVAARLIFQLATFRPARQAAAVRCPLLFVLGQRDVITPPAAALKAARRARDARVLMLDVRHFDAYLGEPFEEAVAAEREFLLLKLGVGGAVAV